ncbi:polyketide synthase [Moniliophthora roreri]|nr:polyketide synthase [Moniliophthora roreri]
MEEIFTQYPTAHFPEIPTYSTLSGERFINPFTSDYFWQNTRGTVDFTKALTSITRDNPQDLTFVEISPHPVLASYISETTSSTSAVLYGARRPRGNEPAEEQRHLLQLLGQLTTLGHNCVDFTSVNGVACYGAKIDIPPYPFVRKSFPLYPDTPGLRKQMRRRHGPLNHPDLRLSRETHPVLAEHVVRGESIMPAAGYLEMAFEFGATTLLDVKFQRVLSLNAENPVQMEIALDGAHWSIKSTLKGQVRLHAEGFLSHSLPSQGLRSNIDLIAIKERCPDSMTDVYPSLSYFSSYGPSFRRINEVRYGKDEMLLTLRGMDDVLSRDHLYHIHPAILDSCFQATALRQLHGNFDPNAYYLPARVAAVFLHQRSIPAELFAYLRVKKWCPAFFVYDIILTDDHGERICTLQSFQVDKHLIIPYLDVERRFHVQYQQVSSIGPLSSQKDQTLHGTERDFLSPNAVPGVVILQYQRGREVKLQKELESLSITHRFQVWVVAVEGFDGDAAKGFSRALRHELSAWIIRLLILPPCVDVSLCLAVVESLPQALEHEPEIVLCPTGVGFDCLVPRIMPITRDIPSSKITVTPSASEHTLLPAGHLRVTIQFATEHHNFVAFIGMVVSNTRGSRIPIGAMVAGFANLPARSDMVVDEAALTIVFDGKRRLVAPKIEHIAGMAVALVAPDVGGGEFHFVCRLRIMVTHCDTAIGRTICELYAKSGVTVHKAIAVEKVVDALQGLQDSRHDEFDLIISGYTGREDIQILNTILHPRRGRMFLWNDEKQGIPYLLQKTPWVLGEALRCSLNLPEVQIGEFLSRVPQVLHPLATSSSYTQSGSRVCLCPTKTYLLIGGIGSLGSRVALWLYERGARRIVMTSRSGRHSLIKPQNLYARRILEYLENQADLTIRLEAVDATCKPSMSRLVESLGIMGGCMILTAVTSDRMFTSLTEDDFDVAFHAKASVFNVVSSIINVAQLDFLVAFSSVSGTVGIPGQTNYAAANSALDGLVALFPNAFSLVAPGITDTGFLLSGGTDPKAARLKRIIDWAASSEGMIRLLRIFPRLIGCKDLIRWLEDGISMVFDGQVISQYIPDLKWDSLEDSLGVPLMGRHLLSPRAAEDQPSDDAADETVQLTHIISKTLQVPIDDISHEVPLTSYGLDSLSASKLVVALAPMLEISQIQLLGDMTFGELVSRVRAKNTRASSATTPSRSTVESEEHKIREMCRLLNLYGANLPRSTQAVSLPERGENRVILLTGSTGTLGVNILVDLLARDDVAKVFALNRPSTDARTLAERQRDAFHSQGCDGALSEHSKLVLLEGRLTSPGFGLNPRLFQEMCDTVTNVVHNAWMVNFVRPLSSYEELIHGTRRLLDFALNAVNRPSLSFISTIGVYRHPDNENIAPEEVINDPAVSIETGYTESKWVAENLLHSAKEISSLKTNVIRVGQLCGSSSRRWSISEWFPCLVKASYMMGCLPSGQDTVAWLPLHTAARVAVDLVAAPAGVYHIGHPNPSSWESIIQPIASTFDLKVVPYSEWLRCLEANISDSSNPAIKLIDFFRLGVHLPPRLRNIRDSLGLIPKMELVKSTQFSATLSDTNLPPLNAEDVKSWLAGWREMGWLEVDGKGVEL